MNKNSIRQPAIYGLFHEGGLFYIGVTGVNIEERMWQHSYRARSGHNAPVYEHIRDIGVENVEIAILHKLGPDDDKKGLEASFIFDAINNGADLRNQISRDGVKDSMSKESRKKIGKAHAGKKTWIYGKRGEDAGWTEERRIHQARLRKESRIQKHGTQSERKKYGCNCDACILWEVDYYSDMEARKVKNQHGTATSYKHGKCRCDKCRTAYREYQRRFK